MIRKWLNFSLKPSECIWLLPIELLSYFQQQQGLLLQKKKTRHLQDSCGVCPCLRLGSLSDPHAGQCLNPWGMWFDFLYHLPYTELRVNIVELKWRLMFRYWCVSIKGRHEVKAEWVYTSYWERLYILNHLEEHFTEKTWNSNLIQSRAIISSIRAQERSLYSTTNILLYYTGLK